MALRAIIYSLVFAVGWRDERREERREKGGEKMIYIHKEYFEPPIECTLSLSIII